MIQRILCPTDLTVNSKSAVAYGFSLAKQNRAELVIFHATQFPRLSQFPCYELENYPYHRWAELVSRFKVDRLLGEAKHKVKHYLDTNFGVGSNGNPWKIRVALGRVADGIVLAALQEEVDLIVLSRRKVGTLSRLLTRSISATVGRDAPCPVVSIGPAKIIRPSLVCRSPLLGEIAQNL